MKTTLAIFISLLLLPSTLSGQKKSYQFNENGISRSVLENYLERAITMVYLLIPEKPEGKRPYPYHADDLRMVKNIGAKFIGRAIYRWGGEALLNQPAFWDTARSIINNLHSFDPDIILQGCLFEIVTEEVDQRLVSWYDLSEVNSMISYFACNACPSKAIPFQPCFMNCLIFW